jgi:hypothetical protein
MGRIFGADHHEIELPVLAQAGYRFDHRIPARSTHHIAQSKKPHRIVLLPP